MGKELVNIKLEGCDSAPMHSAQKLIQISFAANANLVVVKNQLEVLANRAKTEDIRFICCFLNRKMVEAKGFNPLIVDMLENTIGDKLTWEADSFETMEEFMINLDIVRSETATRIDHIYVLDSSTAQGVAREIELFTLGKVVLL